MTLVVSILALSMLAVASFLFGADSRVTGLERDARAAARTIRQPA